MVRQHLDPDGAELIFRLLFSSIFIVLGGEHLLNDDLMQRLMPEWLPEKRLVSVASGVVLLLGGTSIALGVRVHWAAILLGGFLVTVTAAVHVPGMFSAPPEMPADWVWIWDVYQRSNFIKNLCLLGVCFHFVHHEPGRFSLEAYLAARGRR